MKIDGNKLTLRDVFTSSVIVKESFKFLQEANKMHSADSTNLLEVLYEREAHWQKPDIGKLKPKMRSIIVNWMCDQAYDLGMHPRSAMMAISFLDRYASKRTVVHHDAETLAIACLWVAAKYDEVAQFSLSTMMELSVPISTRAPMTAEELLRMERRLLNVLDFRLAIPTPYDFLEALCFSALGHVPSLCTATMLIIRYMTRGPAALPPSQVAGTALVASNVNVAVPMTLVNVELLEEFRSDGPPTPYQHDQNDNDNSYVNGMTINKVQESSVPGMP